MEDVALNWQTSWNRGKDQRVRGFNGIWMRNYGVIRNDIDVNLMTEFTCNLCESDL